jgi:hypothetical protein
MEWTCSRCAAWGDAAQTVLMDIGWRKLAIGIVCPRCMRQLGLDPGATQEARERAVAARLDATRHLLRASRGLSEPDGDHALPPVVVTPDVAAAPLTLSASAASSFAPRKAS